MFPDPESGRLERVAEPRSAVECPTCHQRFSGGDAHFCPFDGDPLVPASGWDPRADPLIGAVVDKRYEVLEVLGEGGMGTVYRVQHASLGRQFALKALRRELASDSDLSARFICEAKAAAAISHPNVVEIIDFGTLPTGQAYFVMELLKGRQLSWLLHSGGPLPAARALRLLRQIAEALGAAHGAGIIHRDLKPDNIHVSEVVGERDVVKVLDFGLAKVLGSSRRTRAGVVFGTPHYMSPEQAMGEAVDARSDIYALGVVMYEMFTGHVPFEADSYMGVLTKHMYMKPVPPSRLPNRTQELGVLEVVLLRCLEKRREDRYASMRELLEDLERVMTSDGERSKELPSWYARRAPKRLADELEAPSTAEPRPAGERARRSSSVWLAAALTIALLGAVSMTLWSVLGHESQPAHADLQPLTSPQITARPALAEPAQTRPAPAPTSVVEPSQNAQLAATAAPSAGASSSAFAPPKRHPPQLSPAASARPNKKARSGALEGSEIVDPWAE